MTSHRIRHATYDLVSRALDRRGLSVTRSAQLYPRQRALLLGSLGTELVIDVGANIGQYARELRAQRFDGYIWSFEPLNRSFSALQAIAQGDSRWVCERLALGSVPGEAIMRESEDLVCSSLRDVTNEFVRANPTARRVATELVTVATLEEIWPLRPISGVTHLKIDTQGFEREVLTGAALVLDSVTSVEIEIPLSSTYEGAAQFFELVEFMKCHSFRPVAFSSGLVDAANGETTDVDALWVKESAGPKPSEGLHDSSRGAGLEDPRGSGHN